MMWWQKPPFMDSLWCGCEYLEVGSVLFSRKAFAQLTAYQTSIWLESSDLIFLSTVFIQSRHKRKQPTITRFRDGIHYKAVHSYLITSPFLTHSIGCALSVIFNVSQ